MTLASDHASFGE